MDSVRPSALGTDAMVGTHRPVAPWLSRGANSGDPGGQTASSTQRRTVRVVACGPVLVQGPVRIEMPDGSTVDSDRPQDSEHPKCWGHPARLSGARDAPRSAVPDNVWSQNGSKSKRPYPIQGRCGRRPRRRPGSRFVPAKGSTDRAGEVRRLGTEPCGQAVAGGPAAATRAVPARPGKSRCG
jgi:hypothetical protein